MAGAVTPAVPQYASRLLAVHPLCPMPLQHRDSWRLYNYKTVDSWTSAAGAEYRIAVCTLCDTAVQLLVLDIVSAPHHLTYRLNADYHYSTH